MDRTARANVTPVRQRTQFTCMSTSMMMCLQANGIACNEDEVNKVMGARPMRGAAWEDALACAQHYGMRAHLTTPSTVNQLKEWTDRGVPVMIAWNPEGRDWSHASVVFDVREDEEHGYIVYVADPNIPDPDETVRRVPKAEFYKKWYEKWPDYLVRRPACAIEREITPDGRQVMASARGVSRLAKVIQACEGRSVEELYLHLSNGGVTFKVVDNGRGPEVIIHLSSFGAMTSDIRLPVSPNTLRDLAMLFMNAAAHTGYSEPDSIGPLSPSEEDRAELRKTFGLYKVVEEELAKVVSAYQGLGGLEKELPEHLRSESYEEGVKTVNSSKKACGAGGCTCGGTCGCGGGKPQEDPEVVPLPLTDFDYELRQAQHEQEAAHYKEMLLDVGEYDPALNEAQEKEAALKTAKFPKGKKMTIDEMVAYFENAGNQAAADEWRAMHDKYKDKIKKSARRRQRVVEAQEEPAPRRERTTERYRQAMAEEAAAQLQPVWVPPPRTAADTVEDWLAMDLDSEMESDKES